MKTIDKGLGGKTHGQPLNRTESLLFKWLGGNPGDERRATELAKHVVLSANPSDAVVEQAVIEALVQAREAVSGRATVKYISGERRDTLRGQR